MGVQQLFCRLHVCRRKSVSKITLRLLWQCGNTTFFWLPFQWSLITSSIIHFIINNLSILLDVEVLPNREVVTWQLISDMLFLRSSLCLGWHFLCHFWRICHRFLVFTVAPFYDKPLFSSSFQSYRIPVIHKPDIFHWLRVFHNQYIGKWSLLFCFSL